MGTGGIGVGGPVPDGVFGISVFLGAGGGLTIGKSRGGCGHRVRCCRIVTLNGGGGLTSTAELYSRTR